MHLLLVESDQRLAGIMGDLFVADGVSVMVAVDAAGGLGAVFGARPDVAIVREDLPDASGLEVVRALRRREGAGPRAFVVLIAAQVDARLRATAESLGVSQVLARPVSLLDLGELVRAAPPLSPATPERPAFHPGNAALLATLWAQRATGVLRVEQPGSSAWVLFSGGGPVGADGQQAVRVALQGGRVELESCPVDGPGDREGLAATLWNTTRAWALASHQAVRDDLLLRPNRRTPDGLALPLRPALRGILRALDGSISRSQIAEALSESVDAVAVDLEALATLGFVELLPRDAPPPRPDPLPRGRPPAFAVDRFTDVRDVALDPEPRPAATSRLPPDPTPNVPPTRLPPRPSLGDPGRPLPTEPAARRPPPLPPPPTRTVEVVDTDPTDPAITRAARSSASSDSRTSPGSPRRSMPIRSIPPVLERALRQVSSTDVISSGGTPRAVDVDAAQQVARLRREADVVRGADPWTVLGVPRDADSSLVEQAGRRMEARYEPLTRSTNPEVAHLATQIANRIKAAASAARTRTEAQARPEAAALSAGRRATAAEAWAEADAAFTRAREHAPDSPEALAGLGWARFHNPQLERAEREEDAIAFLELAVQFNPAFVAAWWQLASIALRQGRQTDAVAHARRVLRVSPGHPDATALVRRLGG